MTAPRRNFQLTPSETFDYAFYSMAHELTRNNEEFKIEVIPPDDKSVYGVRFIVEDKKTEEKRNIVLLSPASDEKEIRPDLNNIGCVPLPDLLKRVSLLQEEDKKMGRLAVSYITPLGECHGRFHWTKLVLRGKEPQFFDPKWRAMSRYDLGPTNEYLKQAGFTPIKKSEEQYVDWQGAFDFNRCGFFVAYSTRSNAKGSLVEEIAKLAPSALEDNFDECRNIEAYKKHIAANEKIMMVRGLEAVPYKERTISQDYDVINIEEVKMPPGRAHKT
jgi:hypothetical protein